MKTKASVTGLGLCAAVLTAGTAHAAPKDDRYYVAVQAAYMFYEDKQARVVGDANGTGGTPSFELSVGRPITDNLNVEVNFLHNRLKSTNARELTQNQLGVEAQYFFNRNQGFAPYVSMGLGYVMTDDDGLQDTYGGLFADVGIGFVQRVTESGIAVRGELRVRNEMSEDSVGSDESFTDAFFQAGIQVPFGRPSSGDSKDGDYDLGGWYVSPMIYYIAADDDRPLSSGNGFGDTSGFGGALGVGRQVTESWDAELKVAHYSIDSESGSGADDTKHTSLQGDILYHFNRNHVLNPYAVAGLAATKAELNNAINYYVTGDIGGGVKYKVMNDIALRGEVRLRIDPQDGGYTRRGGNPQLDILAGLGLNIPLGKTATPEPAPEPAPEPTPEPAPEPPKDSDNDGVTDDQDACPGTPEGTEVDAVGCEIVKQVAPEPAPEPVPQIVDTDNDGVTDGTDQCPNTRSGARIDEYGCEIPEIVVVNFAFDSDQLNSESRRKLQYVAQTMNQRSYIVAIATGHADSRGTARYNLGLSKRRAVAVKRYLIAKGVASNNIVTKWAGESSPIASNADDEGRAMNRRVEVQLMER